MWPGCFQKVSLAGSLIGSDDVDAKMVAEFMERFADKFDENACPYQNQRAIAYPV